MADQQLLILYLRPARNKAREAASVEALSLLRDLHPTTPAGGPLAEHGGLFWITLPSDAIARARARFSHLGYTQAVDMVEPLCDIVACEKLGDDDKVRVARWRKRSWQLVRAYEEDVDALRERAPDRRTFLLETRDGVVRPITGYRGDGQPLSRRGLPVYDARLLVNLVFHPAKGTFLDPFAGIGGLVVEAIDSGWRVLSVDVDPALRHGLARLSTAHLVGDARALPFPSGSIDAIATEPPYDRQAAEMLPLAFHEMHRVLKEGGRLAVFCAAWQAEALRQEAVTLGLVPFLDSPINRKGVGVAVLAWQK